MLKLIIGCLASLLCGMPIGFAGYVSTNPSTRPDNTLWIPKDTSILFTATPDNGTVSVDIDAGLGTVAYSGSHSRLVTFGAYCEGLETIVTFTVTHIDQGILCTDQRDFVYRIYVPKIFSRTVEDTPAFTDKTTRTKIGVGELVNLTIMPEGKIHFFEFEVSSDSLASITPNLDNADKATLTAKDEAGNVVVKLVDGSDVLAEKTFSVTVPSATLTATKVSDDDTMPSGDQGAGMEISIAIGPSDVSFTKIKLWEEAAPPTNKSGYWTSHDPGSHNKGPEMTPDWKNTFGDNAGFHKGTPWVSGGFEWAIPVKWRVAAIPGEKDLTTVTQRFDFDGTSGKTTVTKLGASVERLP